MAKKTKFKFRDILDEQKLAIDVYNVVLDATESLEEGSVGSDLAYIMGAILGGGKFAISDVSRPIVNILAKAYPEDDHPIWRHVVHEDNGDKFLPSWVNHMGKLGKRGKKG